MCASVVSVAESSPSLTRLASSEAPGHGRIQSRLDGSRRGRCGRLVHVSDGDIDTRTKSADEIVLLPCLIFGSRRNHGYLRCRKHTQSVLNGFERVIRPNLTSD